MYDYEKVMNNEESRYMSLTRSLVSNVECLLSSFFNKKKSNKLIIMRIIISSQTSFRWNLKYYALSKIRRWNLTKKLVKYLIYQTCRKHQVSKYSINFKIWQWTLKTFPFFDLFKNQSKYFHTDTFRGLKTKIYRLT